MLRKLASLTCAMTALSAAVCAAQSPEIDAAVERLAPEIIEIRHQIHQNPELGNREHQTAALVVEHLRQLGFEDVRTGVAHTGIVAVLRGGRPGPTIAVRADMDALPVTEDTPLPFKSTVRTEYLGQEVGVSHACGHDVHTSVQLGVASVLASLQGELPGTVVFIFQPAEEGPPPGEEGGADLMLAEGAFDDPRPEAVFGLHTFAEMEVGKVGYTVGPAFAAVDHFRIEIKGQQTHGAYPHLGIDPVVMAAQAVTALQTIRSRNLHPLQPSVVSVGIVRGGTRFNIIPDSVHLEGTVRTYDAGVRDQIERRMEEIIAGVTAAGGGGFELDYERGSPATVNDPELSARMVPTLVAVLGEDNALEIEPTMGGEDFAYFALEVPGFYYRLGMVEPGTESGGHHTPTFLAADGSVPVGMRVMSNVLWDYLEGKGEGRPRPTPGDLLD
ncbi:MAG: amidohydrolase [Thermoanaerobaculia bacterium]